MLLKKQSQKTEELANKDKRRAERSVAMEAKRKQLAAEQKAMEDKQAAIVKAERDALMKVESQSKVNEMMLRRHEQELEEEVSSAVSLTRGPSVRCAYRTRATSAMLTCRWAVTCKWACVGKPHLPQ